MQSKSLEEFINELIDNKIDSVEFTSQVGPTGATGASGTDGKDGRGIVQLGVDEEGFLRVDYTDSTNYTSSISIKGAPGINGLDGKDGKDEAIGPTGRGIQSIEPVGGGSRDYKVKYTDLQESTLVDFKPLDGVNGVTPHIQDNYWYIGEVKQGVVALGRDGKEISSIAFSDQNNPRNAIITYSDNTTGVIQNLKSTVAIDPTSKKWILDGVTTNIKAEGVDGITPSISIDPTSKNWIINAKDTLVKAEGIDGITPTINIDSTTKKWVINGASTDIVAEGRDGTIPTIEIDQDTFEWKINGSSTNVIARGSNGTNGLSAFELFKEDYLTQQGTAYTGTTSDWLLTLKGADGHSPVITIDTETNKWKIDNSLTDVKATGDSAYQIAVNNGYSGNQATWLASLKGVNGDAFTSADVSQESLNSLKGAKGDKGDAFTYSDFTSAQLADLKGEKGDPFTYADFTQAQLQSLKGQDGVGIADLKIESDNLMIKYSDQTTYSILGNVKGDTGAYVSSASLNNNELVLSLSNGSSITAGTITTLQGEAGPTGVSITNITATNNELNIALSNNNIITGITIPTVAGRGISGISLVSSSGLEDTYQMNFTDNLNPFTFIVTNGAVGPTGATGTAIDPRYDRLDVRIADLEAKMAILQRKGYLSLN